MSSAGAAGRKRRVRCWVENSAVVYIVRAMVTASRDLMTELRLLKMVIERQCIELDFRWIASAENRYSDRLFRTWDPSTPQCTRAMVDVLTGSLRECIGKGTVRYRLNGGEHSVAQCKQSEAAMEDWWGEGRARFYNPPPQLLGLTIAKIAREKTRGIVVVPLWIETPAKARFHRLADAVTVLLSTPGRELVSGARAGTEKCPLLLEEIDLVNAPTAGPAGATVADERVAKAWMQADRATQNLLKNQSREKARAYAAKEVLTGW